MQTFAPGIEPLGSHHVRAAFSCGNDTLDRYLKEQASQEERRNFARVFVLVGGEPQAIAGYYSISSTGFARDDLPGEIAKKLPRYDVAPAALIGRLAVDTGYQGQGWGGFLLIDAIKRIVDAGGNVAAYAVVVDAIDDGAVSFYRKYGFISFPSMPSRLFLPVASARQLFAE